MPMAVLTLNVGFSSFAVAESGLMHAIRRC